MLSAEHEWVLECRLWLDAALGIPNKALGDEVDEEIVIRTKHLRELLGIIYTPTVGDAIEAYSHQFRRPEGVFLNYEARNSLDAQIDAGFRADAVRAAQHFADAEARRDGTPAPDCGDMARRADGDRTCDVAARELRRGWRYTVILSGTLSLRDRPLG